MPTNPTNDPPVHDAHAGPKSTEVQVIINGQPVLLADHHQTGASIKQAAIGQGVPIQPDFVLSEVLPNGHQRVIPDDAHVTVKDGDEFWAIPGDDNS